ncbi:exodeoxyribonuclease V subunit alpha [Bowmanella sp. JS7-9]|uniref:RecBCD enzyme subunit RecD n=1 Tax=Pseudobowmanella zhangzhouensis TaxID=1537679 RepID=A0ABW1XIV6_9ALTE|nr:exodeoxyribonuclease V subunit alpha [Bowmanella sp. JS7-9]TBX27475.1 hypothetical protein TK45_01690 [Bowmanella sp. JS7-9]
MLVQHPIIATLLEQGVISSLDSALARNFLEAGESLDAGLLAAWVSHQVSRQQTCVILQEIGQPFAPLFSFSQMPDRICEQSHWIGLPAQTRPLVLDNGRLYLRRYWQYEQSLSNAIRIRAGQVTGWSAEQIKPLLDELFAPSVELDWQKIAVASAALNKFSIITGGPGTGKTTTVTRLLALLSRLAGTVNRPLNIALAAPTGKAAARLSESIAGALEKLPADFRAGLHAKTTTIHRLLGSIPGRTGFNHHSDNPLNIDLLVVDEASMVDLPLMSKLFEALPAEAQVILLGDQQQLASVEVGSVLADLCAFSEGETRFNADFAAQISAICAVELPAFGTLSRIQNNLVVLQKSHRFDAAGGVGRLARQVLAQDLPASLACFEDFPQQLSWDSNPTTEQLVSQCCTSLQGYFDALAQDDICRAFRVLSANQLLCATRRGRFGTEALNQAIEQRLMQQGLIGRTDGFYPGRALMVTQNDHSVGVYNGDIGIVWPDATDQGLLKVWFMDAGNQLRGILPGRIPAVESLYAMTVHKSQGSEFDHVLMVLPGADEQTLFKGLNREMLYTGVTRAKQRFSLFAAKAPLGMCLEQQCARTSGLSDRLAADSETGN